MRINHVEYELCVVPSKSIQNNIIEKWFLELENKFVGVKIDKYVIMPDHIHFILIKNTKEQENITTGEHAGSPLPDIIQWFKTLTTNEYIKMVKNNILKPYNKKIWQRS